MRPMLVMIEKSHETVLITCITAFQVGDQSFKDLRWTTSTYQRN